MMLDDASPGTNSSAAYHADMMLAGVLSLLLVILFILLLHIFGTRYFLPNRNGNTPAPVRLETSRFRSFTAFSFLDATSHQKGLDPSSVASIPVFVCEEKRLSLGESECAICLSAFEEGEIGRRLPTCGHAFHVQCIDMWLRSHFSCPICRSAVVREDDGERNTETKYFSASDDAVAVEIDSGAEQNDDSVPANSADFVQLSASWPLNEVRSMIILVEQ